MCGIAGFTVPFGLPAEERRVRFGSRLRRMAASLRHRGPDAQRGLFLDGVALGHARLAIVDLVGGAQPMRDPDTGVTIVFNGEIFNYLELRERLGSHRVFRTKSDTEVILACYLDRGIDCVLDFIGQFAFAIHDPRSGVLWLARDRVGILPLHYTRTAEGLAFASEAKALFAGGWPAGRTAVSRPGAIGIPTSASNLAPRSTRPAPRRNLALCWWTRCACACAPTCRSRPISPAGSTRASFAASPSRSSAARSTLSRWASRTLASTNAPSRTRWLAGWPRGIARSSSAHGTSESCCRRWSVKRSRSCCGRRLRRCSA